MQVTKIAFIAALLASFAAAQSDADSTSRQYYATDRLQEFNAQLKDSFVSNTDKVQDAFRIHHHRNHRHGAVPGRCGINKLRAQDLPASYNDKSTGFFVDMGLILTEYYGVTAKMSKLQMNSIARTFAAPLQSYAKAQKKVSITDLHNSVLGLLQILVEHSVNDTFIGPSDWKNYNINRKVFSEIHVNDLLRTRSRLLKTAQDRDNGSEEVIHKETAVRRMQMKIFKAKDPSTMDSIINTDIDWRQYRTRFSQYMWNICAHTQDRETIRQVRNHFAYWLATGQEDEESEKELTATYSESGDPSSFFYPQGVKLSLASALYTLLGAALIGVFLSV